MNNQSTDDREQIDGKTSRSICHAVGERLRRELDSEPLRLSSQLQHLMNELRRLDNEKPARGG